MRSLLLRVVCSLSLLGCGDDGTKTVSSSEPEAGVRVDAAAASDASGDGAARDAADRAPADATLPDAGRAEDAGLCAAFAPETPSRTPVTVRLTNRTQKSLFLGLPGQNCGSFVPYTLSSASGAQYASAISSCAFTCEAVQRAQCAACPPVCPPVSVTELVAGGSLSAAWGGSVFAQETMPAACYPSGCGGPRACYVERAAPDSLIVGAQAYPAAVCASGSCGACTASGGSCTVPGAQTVSGTPLSTSVTWSTGQAVAELVFQ